MPSFSIQVYTGSKDLAGTTADVGIIVYGNDGQSSELLLAAQGGIFERRFAKGQVDTFSISEDKLGSLTTNSDIQKLEVWIIVGARAYSSDWYLEKIIITNENSGQTYTFPWLRWITTSDRRHHLLLLDTSLPQSDGVSYATERAEELKERRDLYQLVELQGCYARVETMPADDKMLTADYNELILETSLRKLIQGSNQDIKTWTQWDSIDDIKEIYKMPMFDTPPGNLDDWDNDVHFGRQRLTGVNHNLLTRVTEIPSKFPVTDDLLGDLLEGMTIAEAIERKRLFSTDLEILKGITASGTNTGTVLCAPVALFFEDGQGDLVPVAIQLFQEPGHDNPVFTRDDEYHVWTLAKMWYNNADGAYQQAITHLGKTHYLMDGAYGAASRQLSPSHPVYKLLRPHFHYTLAINEIADDLLSSDEGAIDTTMTYGTAGLLATMEKGFTDFELNTIDSLPEDLRRRGLDDLNVLPGYHARNDAMLVYDAIHSYVENYVGLYYKDTDLLEQDFELQNWAEELSKPTADGGVGLRGVPGGGALTNTEDLVTIATSVIFTASCGHAMANFGQYEAYGFPPNYPLILRGSPPSSKTEEKTMRDILDALPDVDATTNAIRVFTLLDSKRTLSLGYFEVDYVYDPEALAVIQQFRDDLDLVTEEITRRNQLRSPAYEVMLPDNIPNAVSI